jgi:hypothetical protein
MDPDRTPKDDFHIGKIEKAKNIMLLAVTVSAAVLICLVITILLANSLIFPW